MFVYQMLSKNLSKSLRITQSPVIVFCVKKRTAGAHRVSESVGVTLTEILEEYGLEISREAIKLAEHAGRKTVKAEDIKLAKEMILNLTQHVTTDKQEAQLVVEPRMTKEKIP